MIRRLWMSRLQANWFISEASDHEPQETGGILMGYYDMNEDVVVTNVIGPGPRAVHSPTTFKPDYAWQRGEVARVYEEQNRFVTYLGDWHSHPGAQADLSDRDRETLGRIAKSEEARAERALMAILGVGSPWTIRVWCGRMTGRRWWPKLEVIELELEFETESHRRFE